MCKRKNAKVPFSPLNSQLYAPNNEELCSNIVRCEPVLHIAFAAYMLHTENDKLHKSLTL